MVLATLPGYRQLCNLITRFNIRYRRGVYRSFAEARAAIPSRRRVGHDNPETAKLYLDHLGWVKPGEEKIIQWLGQLFSHHNSVFDFGGNLGRSYYVYQRHMHYPTDLRWIICDVPAVVDAGRELALQRKAPHLTFTVDFNQANDLDILLTCGVLHLVEKELADLLRPLPRKPCHVLINRIPLWDGRTYYTRGDIGPTCCPNRIGNKDEFIDSLQCLGYSLIDSWACPASCRVLFRPSRTLRHFTGMYFRLDSATC
jgi:putative methyltransferase (TIGR04325 family)